MDRLLLIVGALAIIAGTSAAGSGPSASSRALAQTLTLGSGIYTELQAERGKQSYRKTCGYCHGDDLKGVQDDGAPPLTGDAFIASWRGQPLSDLFLMVGERMPKNDPASLTPQTVIDIVAFILRSNRMPSGAAELPPDLPALDAIMFTDAPAR